MNDPSPTRLRRWLAASGLLFVGMNVAFLAMVFSIGSPPPALDDPTLGAYLQGHAGLLATVTLISYLSLAPFMVFVASLRSLLRQQGVDSWLADAVFALGAVFAAIAFVDFGIMGTAVASAVGSASPTTVRTIEELGRYLGNLPSSLEWGMLMAVASAAFWVSGALPRWVSWTGWIGAGIILATSASLYVGDTPSFLAADGGIALLGLLPFLLWMVGTSLSVLRGQRGTRPTAGTVRPEQGMPLAELR